MTVSSVFSSDGERVRQRLLAVCEAHNPIQRVGNLIIVPSPDGRGRYECNPATGLTIFRPAFMA